MRARQGCDVLRLVIPGTPLAVREALRRVFAAPLLCALDEDARGTAELVLAEVLNNVVEHAYAGAPGEIDLRLGLRPGSLMCMVRDRGRPMPGGRLPGGVPPVIRPDDPPEGGFGWHLIRSLSQDLRYRRAGGRNHLRFRVETRAGA
jgi:serine/threonine-protein kinase RsbW